jgi:hypothetical protein
MNIFSQHAWDIDAAAQYYGAQPSRQQWEVGDTSPKTICETWANPEFLWRLNAFGENIRFELLFGTRGQVTLDDLLSPLRVLSPGKFLLTAKPANPAQPAWAIGGYTVATGGLELLRALHTFAGTPIVLPSLTRSVTAITAATVTVDGTAVPLAQGASLQVGGVVTVTGGTVIADYAT